MPLPSASGRPILRLHYVGDVTPDILSGNLRVEILPLRKDAPIYLAREARPDFGSQRSVLSLNGIEIIPRYQIQLETR
jgi:hypothetical protein